MHPDHCCECDNCENYKENSQNVNPCAKHVLADKAANTFCGWFLEVHGALPYGFYRSAKKFYLEGYDAATTISS